MKHRKSQKTRAKPMEQEETWSGRSPAEDQARLVHPDQASGWEAHPGFGHVQFGRRQQATPLRWSQPEGEDVAPHGM